ncbi:MAG: universal stress protein [Chitinophagaceae bacterium]|nr:universal stress protein [Chitinophagaceae bacterium]
MKKILVAFDGLKYSVPTQEYAVRLASRDNALLVGVFLDDLYYRSYKIYDIIQEEEGGIDTKRQRSFDKRDASVRTNAIKLFSAACEKAGIQFSIHKDHKAAIRELLKESIYADLLVISSSETFSKSKEDIPTTFIQDLLPHIQCPVFVVPSSYRQIDELILLYDGEPSSVHAIKMLGYVLPSFQSLYTEIVTVKKQQRGAQLPDAGLIKEFITQHFPKTGFHILHGNPETGILSFLRKKRPNTLVVLGAYRRSAVSRWFRPSMADMLISKLNLPLFIAHNK